MVRKIPSVVKKYLMAVSGLVMVLFVLGHMVGNLQMFVGAELMNEYAHKLQTMPYGLLWVVRIGLLVAVGVHVWMAILLTIENKRARPEEYAVSRVVQASVSSKTMGVSGSIVLFFIVFHLLHFTTKSIFPEYGDFWVDLNGERVHDVYRMVLEGFSVTWVSLFYIGAMYLLSMHLSHGVSSMFQSLGLRSNKHRKKFDFFAKFYGCVIFLGFTSVPLVVLMSKYTQFKFFPL